MTKRFLWAIWIILVLAAGLVIYLAKVNDNRAGSPITSANSSRVMEVEEVVTHPERFKGSLGVTGTVVKIDKPVKETFILGCEDGCIMMPVKYKGQLPEAGKEIVVYGEIKKDGNGKYIFEAKEIELK